MANLKHAITAVAAIVMVGSLAAHQSAGVSHVSAAKSNVKIQFKQPDILKGDGNGIVLGEIPSKTDDDETEKTNETQTGKAYVLITESILNLRSEPSTESEPIAQLECAAEIEILSDEGDWYKVQAGENCGYVYKKFVTYSYDEAKAALLENFKYEAGSVISDGVNVRDAAGTESNVIDQVDAESRVYVIEHTNDEWLKVYYGRNYDVGYIKAEFVQLGDVVDKDEIASAKRERINSIAKKGVVNSDGAKLNIRVSPDDNSESIGSLNDGEEIRIVSKGSNWTKIAIGNSGSTAYVKTDYILDEDQIAAREAAKKAAQEAAKAAAKKAAATPKKTAAAAKTAAATQKKTAVKAAATETVSSSTGSASGQAIVNEAKKYLGVRYVYGGTSPSTGFDCSGLVQYACRKVGISVNRSSKSQYSNGVAVAKSDLQPGDLVFFSKGSGISHVVIYAGNGQVIHAPSPGKTVCYQSLSTICGYSKYVGARRVAQ